MFLKYTRVFSHEKFEEKIFLFDTQFPHELHEYSKYEKKSRNSLIDIYWILSYSTFPHEYKVEFEY